MPRKWQGFLDSLDTPGGHILVLATALMLLFATHAVDAEKFRGEIIGALLLACRGAARQ